VKTVQSIERAFAILDAVTTRRLALSEISEQVSLPKSTVSRILHTLETVGAVTRDPANGAYGVGVKLRSMSRSAATMANLALNARPYLAMLAREIGEDAGVGAADHSQVRFIAQENADNTIQVSDWTGAMIPMHLVPAGLVILANWPPTKVDRALEGPLEPATRKSVADRAAIRERLVAIREDGYCWVFGEFSEELNSVAAPVFGPTGVIGAISVHGPAFRFPNPGSEERIGRRICEVADLLSATYRVIGED